MLSTKIKDWRSVTDYKVTTVNLLLPHAVYGFADPLCQ